MERIYNIFKVKECFGKIKLTFISEARKAPQRGLAQTEVNPPQARGVRLGVEDPGLPEQGAERVSRKALAQEWRMTGADLTADGSAGRERVFIP